MNTTIQTVKGTREFYPEDMFKRIWLYKLIREVSESFGYEEYDGPFLEKIDLYAAKSGEELVKEQSFVFQDRGGDPVTLRPELTPSLARMVAQRQKSLFYPLKWWSFGPFWRYEKPQKGRTREFFQWNIDLIGVESPEADAELIAICAEFFRKVGFTPEDVQIHVNNRRLMEQVFEKIGISADKRNGVFRLIDRQGKMTPQEWQDFALETGLSLKQFNDLRGFLADPDLWKESEEMQRLFAAITAFGVQDYIVFDPKIIRGLDYYTATVFEAIHLKEGGRSVLGGGRYDNLVGDVGGDPLSGVGFAMGDVLVTILLEKYGLLPEYSSSSAQVMVTIFDQENFSDALEIATTLRSGGIKVMNYSENAKLGKQFKFADRKGIRFVILAGPDEIQNSQVTIKDLQKGTQETILRGDLVTEMYKLLA